MDVRLLIEFSNRGFDSLFRWLYIAHSGTKPEGRLRSIRDVRGKMTPFGVSPDKEQALAERMEELGIHESGYRREVHPFRRPRRAERQQGRDLRLSQAPPDRHRGQMPAGAVPVAQPVPGPPHPDRQDRDRHPRQRERRGTADRQDPASEKEALEAGQGQDAGRQAPRRRKEERPGVQARPSRRLSGLPLNPRCSPDGSSSCSRPLSRDAASRTRTPCP